MMDQTTLPVFDQATLGKAFEAISSLDNFLKVIIDGDPNSLVSTFAQFNQAVEKETFDHFRTYVTETATDAERLENWDTPLMHQMEAFFKQKFQGTNAAKNELLTVIYWVVYGIDRLSRRFSQVVAPPFVHQGKDTNCEDSGFKDIDVIASVEAITERIQLITDLSSSLEKDVASLPQTAQLAAKREGLANRKIQALNKEHEILKETAAKEIASLQQKMEQMAVEMAEMRKKEEAMEADAAKLAKDIEYLREDNADLNQVNAKVGKALTYGEHQYKRLEEKLNEKRSLIKRMKEKIRAQQEEVEQLKNQAQEAKKEPWKPLNLTDEEGLQLLTRAQVVVGLIKPPVPRVELKGQQLLEKARSIVSQGKPPQTIPAPHPISLQ